MPDPYTLLVVDDDPDFCEIQRLSLSLAGFRVLTAFSGREALTVIDRERPHLVLLDVMMPGMDGWETLERIRALGPVPVILLTALGMVEDRIRGLKGGADDYVPKPFHREELVGRIQAILKRRRNLPITPVGTIKVGWAEIDLARAQVLVQGTVEALAEKEWHILRVLATHMGEAVSYETLVCAAWPGQPERGRAGLKVVVSRLRRKLQDEGSPSQLLHSVRGVGYLLSHRPRLPASTSGRRRDRPD